MQVLIIGAGNVGHHLARQLLLEGHDVTVVDERPEALQAIGERLDVQTVQGSGSQPNILAQAGAAHADVLLAVTPQDEINLVACQMAYSLFRVPRKLARVSQKSFLALTESDVYTPSNVPVDAVISPEYTVAEALVRAVEVPGAFEVFPLFNGRITLIGTHLVERACPLLNLKLSDLELDFVPLGAYRGERVVLFQKSDHLEQDDELYLLCKTEKTLPVMSMLGAEPYAKKRALIIGGGQVGGTVCQMLEQKNFKTKVIEKSYRRAIELAEELHHTTVLHGEGLDQDLLEQENIKDMNVVLVTTASDTTNILTAVQAERMGAQNVITIINDPMLIPVAESMNLSKIVCPQEITVSRVLRQLRPGKVHDMFSLRDEAAELVDITIRDESPLIGQALTSVSLPKGLKIAALMRGEDVYLDAGKRTLRKGDRLAIFGARKVIKEAADLF
jgi:trk system potassium uptake protein TrkA